MIRDVCLKFAYQSFIYKSSSVSYYNKIFIYYVK